VELDPIPFWVEAQKTARYFADKHSAYGLQNFESSMYCQLVYALERFYLLNSIKLDIDVETFKLELEQQSDDDLTGNAK